MPYCVINTNDITVIHSNAIYINQLIEFENYKIEKLVFSDRIETVSVVYICTPFYFLKSVGCKSMSSSEV